MDGPSAICVPSFAVPVYCRVQKLSPSRRIANGHTVVSLGRGDPNGTSGSASVSADTPLQPGE